MDALEISAEDEEKFNNLKTQILSHMTRSESVGFATSICSVDLSSNSKSWGCTPNGDFCGRHIGNVGLKELLAKISEWFHCEPDRLLQELLVGMKDQLKEIEMKKRFYDTLLARSKTEEVYGGINCDEISFILPASSAIKIARDSMNLGTIKITSSHGNLEIVIKNEDCSSCGHTKGLKVLYLNGQRIGPLGH